MTAALPNPVSTSTRAWTPQQREAITSVEGGVLVSAAAGSGKTAVLAERCAHLVCNSQNPCDIGQLLVVTFTESAAAEMKNRIQRALNDRHVHQPSDRLARQIALVEYAHVSTVHGFCNSVLRQNFNLAGLDPDFKILGGDEASLLQRDTATELFHQKYDRDETGDFHRLIDAYGDGDDERLIEQIISTHNLLCSLVDPADWIANAASAIHQAAEQPLERGMLGRRLIEQVESSLDAMIRLCDGARQSIFALGDAFNSYLGQLQEFSATFEYWRREVLPKGGYDMLVGEVRDFLLSAPAAPRIAGQPPGKVLAKSLLDEAKAGIKEGVFADLTAFTAAEWQDGMMRIAPHAQAFLDLVTEFGVRYGVAKADQRALDFADLERHALNILRDDPKTAPGASLRPSAVARAFHRQFTHILVDEYQDINAIQDAILRLVSRECLVDSPAAPSRLKSNLFCVGDVKQSIFRFRLAEPRRFLDRQKRLATSTGDSIGKVIDLRENFRARAPLLNAINAIFERLMTRAAVEIEYDASHRLSAGLRYPPPDHRPGFIGAPVELHLIPRKIAAAGDGDEANPSNSTNADIESSEYEAILIARRIREMMGQESSTRLHVVKPDASGGWMSTPIEYGDIVILLRSMRYKADTYADVLRAHGIPVHNGGGAGFFESREIRDMLALLHLLDNQQQDIPLAAVLRGPLAGIPSPDSELARVRLAYSRQQPVIAFHEAARRYADEQDDELAARLRDVFADLADWRDQANKRPVAELVWRIYDQTGFLAYCAGLPDGAQRVANLIELHERAGQFGTFSRQGLFQFLRFLDSLRLHQDISRPSIAGQGDGAVRIMSIHRSKGLEFPVVILPDLGKQHNLDETRGTILIDRLAGLGMSVVDPARMIHYPSLASVLVRQSLWNQALAEELRLLYVAMTRAREHLILVATCPEDSDEEWKSHAGPLPPDRVLEARRPIDWLGPVAAMTASAASPPFQITTHSSTEVGAWRHPRHHQPSFSEHQTQLSRLLPLDPAPDPSESAAQLIRRFETVYPWRGYTTQRASAPVTSLAKESVELMDSDDRLGDMIATRKVHAGEDSVPDRKLDLPRFFVGSTSAKATDIGTATHLVLQHWDFSRPADPIHVATQIESLITRKFISSIEARWVDRQAIEWLLRGPLGGILRKHQDQLLRELPFALARPPQDISLPPSTDPLDQLMVRGRIDLLVPLENKRLVLVDYKTDNVNAQTVADRANTHMRQMELYRQAIEDITHQTVIAIYLVFLTPRILVRSRHDRPNPGPPIVEIIS